MVNKTSWGKVADWYNELLEEGIDTYQEKVILPNLLRILDLKKGQEVLDIGCGQGYFSRSLAKQGVKVLGTDIGNELIKIAKDKSGPSENYLVLSAEKLTNLANNRFDLAICVLAIQNIKNLQAAVSELSRVLKNGGKAVLVLNHPTFRIPTASGWGFDEKSKIQYRRIDKYMSEITQQVDMTQGQKDINRKQFTYSFHRPLQVYFKTFKKSNLAVTSLEEWMSHKVSDKGPRKQAEDFSRKEIPLFMAIELKKGI